MTGVGPGCCWCRVAAGVRRSHAGRVLGPRLSWRHHQYGVGGRAALGGLRSSTSTSPIGAVRAHRSAPRWRCVGADLLRMAFGTADGYPPRAVVGRALSLLAWCRPRSVGGLPGRRRGAGRPGPPALDVVVLGRALFGLVNPVLVLGEVVAWVGTGWDAFVTSSTRSLTCSWPAWPAPPAYQQRHRRWLTSLLIALMFATWTAPPTGTRCCRREARPTRARVEVALRGGAGAARIGCPDRSPRCGDGVRTLQRHVSGTGSALLPDITALLAARAGPSAQPLQFSVEWVLAAVVLVLTGVAAGRPHDGQHPLHTHWRERPAEPPRDLGTSRPTTSGSCSVGEGIFGADL